MDIMFESSTSEGIPLGKRPASSSASLERRGKKRAAEQMEQPHDTIRVLVKSQMKEVQFKVKGDTKMQKIFKMFCDRAQVEYRTMRFLIDGSRVPPTATPNELKMRDGDEIEAMIYAGGGGNVAVV